MTGTNLDIISQIVLWK